MNFLWGHGVKISDLLLRLAVSVLNSIKNFSFKHKRQSPAIGLYPLALARIFHFTSKSSLYIPLIGAHKSAKKTPLLRCEQSEPSKVPPSLSREARKVSLSTYPLLVHTKVPKKTPLLRGKQSKPCEVTPSPFPFLHTPYWLTQKCQKSTTFER